VKSVIEKSVKSMVGGKGEDLLFSFNNIGKEK
jgi:hypothetical protein